MATRTLAVLVDDLDGTPAQQTVPFGLDGVTYEIDLSEDNADRLRAFLDPFVNAGRRTGGRRRPVLVHDNDVLGDLVADGGNGAAAAPATGSGKSGKARAARKKKSARNGQDRSKTIRQWALDNGYEISARGKLPAHVETAYEQAQG